MCVCVYGGEDVGCGDEDVGCGSVCGGIRYSNECVLFGSLLTWCVLF